MEIVLIVISVAGGCLSSVFLGLYQIQKFRLRDTQNQWLIKEQSWRTQKADLELQLHDQNMQIESADSHYQKMESLFEKATQKAFETNQQNFLDQASQKMSPLTEQLSHTQKNLSHLKDMLEKNRDHGVAIETTMDDLKTQTQKLRDIFNHSSQRGSWGEIQLKNLLESAGLLHHCDFVSQPHVLEPHNHHQTIRPDVIVCLPAHRHIVIDVKAPMDSYIKSQNTTHESDKARFLKEHCDAVKKHVNELSHKKYYEKIYTRSSQTYPSTTPEFVVMFLPVESLYAEAFGEHRDIFEQACKKNVIITTPSSLLALLKTIAFSWKQHHYERRSQAIQRQSKEILTQLERFFTPFEKIGKALNTATKEYDKAYGVFNRNILPHKARLDQLAETPYFSEREVDKASKKNKLSEGKTQKIDNI